MNHGEVDQSEFDDRVTRMLRELGKRCTRRGAFSSIGRVLLRLTGVALTYPLLPVDRIVPIADATTNCDYWYGCGICGNSCGCCGGTGITCPSACPSMPNSSTGSWSCCCTNELDRNYIINYYDCCAPSSNPGACTGCTTPPCNPCCNNNPLDTWCGNNFSQYRCTIYKNTFVPC